MALFTAQAASFMELDYSTSLPEPDIRTDQAILADLEMDLDSQAKDDLIHSNELPFDTEDLGFDNPFANFEADTDTPPQGVQSLQEEFALAAGYLQPLDFRLTPQNQAEFGSFNQVEFGGFADPAGGLGAYYGLEDDHLRLRRAEGGVYGFDIVVRGGVAYPVLHNGEVLQAFRGEHAWHDAGHPVLQGGQTQDRGQDRGQIRGQDRGQDPGQDQDQQQQQRGVFRRGVGQDGFEGVLRGFEGVLGEEAQVDPVVGVGVHAFLAQEIGGRNPRNNNGGNGDGLYIDFRNEADLRAENEFAQVLSDRTVTAAAAAHMAAGLVAPGGTLADLVTPAGALPPPPPRPDLAPPGAGAANVTPSLALVGMASNPIGSLSALSSVFELARSTSQLATLGQQLLEMRVAAERDVAAAAQMAAIEELVKAFFAAGTVSIGGHRQSGEFGLGDQLGGSTDPVFIGGHNQGGSGNQPRSLARQADSAAASSSRFSSSASKRCKDSLRMKPKSMKRRSTSTMTACKPAYPSMFATLPTAAVC